jgi:outer membrane protein assembly factor BamD (BamD/ComL family)
LDQHLTAAEAEPLRELARGVITKARENLGAQFKLAVRDRQWREAVPIGERIIAEFPNSRMAAEVRDVIDNLRQKVTQTA